MNLDTIVDQDDRSEQLQDGQEAFVAFVGEYMFQERVMKALAHWIKILVTEQVQIRSVSAKVLEHEDVLPSKMWALLTTTPYSAELQQEANVAVQESAEGEINGFRDPVHRAMKLVEDFADALDIPKIHVEGVVLENGEAMPRPLALLVLNVLALVRQIVSLTGLLHKDLLTPWNDGEAVTAVPEKTLFGHVGNAIVLLQEQLGKLDSRPQGAYHHTDRMSSQESFCDESSCCE